jgi:uncharacterized protein
VSEPGITVVGHGAVAAAPDVLVLRLGTEARHPNVSAALAQAAGAMSAMVARLREAGIADADLRTTGASLWSHTDGQGRLTGHVASQALTAKLRDLPAAGDLVAEVVAAGGDAARLQGLSFAIDDNAALLERARRAAFADARARAELYATLAGRPLGPVRRVQEVFRHYEPVATMAIETQSVSVEPGSQETATSVEVEWTFAD